MSAAQYRKKTLRKTMDLSNFALASLDDRGECKYFLKWCQKNKTHLVSVWRRLDKDGSMSLHRMEFIRGMRDIRYDGDVEKLWSQFDSDHTGTLSFTEFAPENALDLARFKQWAVNQFGSLQAAFRCFDADRSGSITLEEFTDAVNQQEGFPDHLAKSVELLFLLLDDGKDNSSLTITEDELLFLDRWQSPAYLWEEADVAAKDRLKAALLRRNNDNALLAWRKVLDKDSSMRVNFDEFCAACKVLARNGLEEARPPGGAASGVSALFVALDSDRSGWFSLRNWDEEAYMALVTFTTWAKSKTGKVTDCIRTMAQGKPVTWNVFKQAVRSIGLKSVEVPLVFEGLCKGSSSFSAGDAAFLDRWDPVNERKEEEAWERMAGRRISC